MTVFAVVSSTEYELMKAAIIRKIRPENFYMVHQGFWFIDSQFATSKELCSLLSPDQNIGSYVIFPVNAYYGYHDKTIWEWLSGKGI
ncbi:hypothetical protein ACQ86O_08140 [Serratia sp. L9]|uniref:hypothetical protein n=1 Tax=Serratia sp. L9 TaxID=3423946 RepID=UPI003D6748A1